MLTTLKRVLDDARTGRYAVPAFDCVEDVMVRAVLETSERLGAPAILMGLVGADLEGNGWAYLAGLARAAAACHDIPVVLHLDHATGIDQIRRAVDTGFSSVMIDGSALAFEENVALTAEAVDIARPHGVSVEGELGHVGGSNLEGTVSGDSTLTEPEEVVRFIEQTGIDALAVSIGTAHGVYTCLPNLDIGRLKALDRASTVPLVLHGGSGTPDDQVREAVRGGICKLNVYAENRMALKRGLLRAVDVLERDDPPPRDAFRPLEEAVSAVVASKIRLCGAQGRAGGETP